MSAPPSRMLTLLSLLQARRDWPGPALAERLDVSERTVRRDVDRLRELGYRVVATKGPDGGYRLDAGAELPPLLFDDEQAIAVAVALQSVGSASAGVEEAAVRALATVRQVMPARLRPRLDALRFTAVPGSGAVVVDPETLVALGAAIRSTTAVRFDYATDRADADAPPRAPRQVEPHHLVARGGRWYLVAWDAERADWRVFRVDRMTLRSHGGRSFRPRELPGGDVAAFVEARFRGGDGSVGSGEWPCRGEVVVQLPAAEVAPYLRDAVVEPLGTDRTRVRLGGWSWAAIVAAVAGFDAELDAVAPAELAAAFRRVGERLRSVS